MGFYDHYSYPNHQNSFIVLIGLLNYDRDIMTYQIWYIITK